MERPAPPLGRRARIEEPDAPGPLDDRQVGMAEDDRIAARKPLREPIRAPGRRAGYVDHADASLSQLDNELLRQQLAQRRLVRIPVHRLYGRPECP